MKYNERERGLNNFFDIFENNKISFSMGEKVVGEGDMIVAIFFLF